MEEGNEDLAWIWYLGERIVENFFEWNSLKISNLRGREEFKLRLNGTFDFYSIIYSFLSSKSCSLDFVCLRRKLVWRDTQTRFRSHCRD